MRAAFFMSFSLILTMGTLGLSQSLSDLRNNYVEAVSNKEVCEKMIGELERNANTSIKLAYLGAFETIWANHVSNPIAKLRTFKKGKMKIEEAVKKDKDNVEIRFIRLSIQKNAPGILGYRSNIKEDELFLKANLHKISSTHLKTQIETILEK